MYVLDMNIIFVVIDCYRLFIHINIVNIFIFCIYVFISACFFFFLMGYLYMKENAGGRIISSIKKKEQNLICKWSWKSYKTFFFFFFLLVVEGKKWKKWDVSLLLCKGLDCSFPISSSYFDWNWKIAFFLWMKIKRWKGDNENLLWDWQAQNQIID